MEQQFKKLIKLKKDQDGWEGEQKDPLSRSFEGALFSGSSWFFHTETTPLEIDNGQEAVAAPPAKLIETNSNTQEPLIEVLFVGDTHRGEGEDLLGKMISAMKLAGVEFSRFILDEELEEVSDLENNLTTPGPATLRLLKNISEKRPKIVVSLGATVTNILLGKREKLSTIHGQFIEKTAGDWIYTLMPLFHPDFLLINPNMKRTAWIDLQKVMERVGKI